MMERRRRVLRDLPYLEPRCHSAAAFASSAYQRLEVAEWASAQNRLR